MSQPEPEPQPRSSTPGPGGGGPEPEPEERTGDDDAVADDSEMGTGAHSAGELPPKDEQGEGAADGDDPRRTAHEILGQAHALLGYAFDERVMSNWCPQELREDMRATREPLWDAIAQCHIEVASGEHDRGLRTVGLGGPLSRPKRRLLRTVLERLSNAVKHGRVVGVRKWLRAGAGVAATAVGSLAKEIPGGEVIVEAISGITSALDAVDALEKDVII